MIDSFLSFLFHRRTLIATLLIASTAVILYITLMPSDKIGSHSLYQYDKAGHFVLFFGWTFLFGLLMISVKEVNANLILIFIAGSLFGIIIELMQDWLPFGRSADLHDAIADILGALAATLVLFVIRRRVPKISLKNSKP
ncbi:MAG: hypothetical protein EA360_03060 [Balneolaceae bacterium]|nr:MAG: hypothetical protein EA360_03060 [Balneolaceae bacterium]